MSIGTTCVFPYIAGPIKRAARIGVPTIEINPGESEVSALVRLRIRARASVALPRLLRALEAWARQIENFASQITPDDVVLLDDDPARPNITFACLTLTAKARLEETLRRFPEWHVDEREVQLVRTSTVRGPAHVPFHI